MPEIQLPLPVFDLHAHLPYQGEDLWGEWGRCWLLLGLDSRG